MRVAVVDVVAENGGSLSVLMVFLNYIEKSEEATEHRWYVFTSFPLDINCRHIKNIVCKETKQSWFHKLKWENSTAKQLFEKYKIDVVFSLQNTGFKSLNIAWSCSRKV